MHNITIEIDGHGTLTGDPYLLAILGELAKTASFTMAHSGEAYGAIKAFISIVKFQRNYTSCFRMTFNLFSSHV